MENFQFANSEYLYGLLIIPILIVWYIIYLKNKRKAIKKIGNEDVLKRLMPEASKTRPVIKFSIMLLALSFLILAAARPQFGSKLQEISTNGAEIIIALDISNSMLAEDIYPNRLEKAKTSIVKMLDKLYTDKIGIIIFAGEAKTQVPMTNDYTSSKLFIKSIDVDFIDIQGTAIAEAINLAMNSFSPENDMNKAIIVISDGENHEGDAVLAATTAKEKGVVVHTIGIGTDKAVPIPSEDGNSQYKKNSQGEIVMTELNEEMMQEIAKAGGGVYVKANNSTDGLEYVYDEIEKIEKGEITSYAAYDEKFHYLVFAALLLLLFEVVILERKNRILNKIKLFK